MEKTIKQLKEANRALENELVLTKAILDAVMDTLAGEQVSDFMESFEEVQTAKLIFAKIR